MERLDCIFGLDRGSTATWSTWNNTPSIIDTWNSETIPQPQSLPSLPQTDLRLPPVPTPHHCLMITHWHCPHHRTLTPPASGCQPSHPPVFRQLPELCHIRPPAKPRTTTTPPSQTLTPDKERKRHTIRLRIFTRPMESLSGRRLPDIRREHVVDPTVLRDR